LLSRAQADRAGFGWSKDQRTLSYHALRAAARSSSNEFGGNSDTTMILMYFLLTRTVLGALRDHITDGEWQDIRSAHPSELAAILSQGR
jgi:uncharacterized protein (DUF2267 family)